MVQPPSPTQPTASIQLNQSINAPYFSHRAARHEPVGLEGNAPSTGGVPKLPVSSTKSTTVMCSSSKSPSSRKRTNQSPASLKAPTQWAAHVQRGEVARGNACHHRHNIVLRYRRKSPHTNLSPTPHHITHNRTGGVLDARHEKLLAEIERHRDDVIGEPRLVFQVRHVALPGRGEGKRGGGKTGRRACVTN